MAAKTRKPRTPKAGRIDPSKPASIVIGKFGGLARFCEISGDSPSTVDGWLVRGTIPSRHFERIKGLATDKSIPLNDSDFVPQ